MPNDPYTGCVEQLAGSPELVRQLLRDHVATTDGWCQEHGAHLQRHPCSIRQLAERAKQYASQCRTGGVPT